jgi:hypothetical protein
VFCIAYFSANATLRRVNNNPGIVLPAFGYTSFSAAQTAASNGDTIYIEPSNISYGSMSMSKSLTIVGPGYLLDQNTGTPADKRSAVFTDCTINAGSNGSVLTGLTFHNGITYGNITIFSSNNITISRCIFQSFSLTVNISNYSISQNVIVNNLTTGNNGLSSSLISNNIILGNLSSVTSGIVKNNLIYGVPVIDDNVNYYNNIFIGNNTSTDLLNSVVAYNNVCVFCTGTANNNNFYTNAYSTIFNATEPRILDDLEDARFQLPSTSPAKGKGVGGVDCGPFGGINPYVLSGIPPYPSITAITVGTQSGSNIPITFSAKRNN